MDYVSPIDPRTVRVQPPAMRPGSLAGRTVVLLDITKHRGAEFLDHVERLLQGHDARTLRRSKQTFSRPATVELIEQIAIHGDLCVEGLAD